MVADGEQHNDKSATLSTPARRRKESEHDMVVQVEGSPGKEWKLSQQIRPKKAKANLSCIEDTLDKLKADDERRKKNVAKLTESIEFCWMAQAVSTGDLSSFPTLEYEELTRRFEELESARKVGHTPHLAEAAAEAVALASKRGPGSDPLDFDLDRPNYLLKEEDEEEEVPQVVFGDDVVADFTALLKTKFDNMKDAFGSIDDNASGQITRMELVQGLVHWGIDRKTTQKIFYGIVPQAEWAKGAITLDMWMKALAPKKPKEKKEHKQAKHAQTSPNVEM